MHVERLPSREEWEARQRVGSGRAAAPAAAGLRHGPAIDLPRRVRIGLLALAPLALAAGVVAIALAGGQSATSGVVTMVRVTSASMAPTLPVGSTVRVLIAPAYAPRVGDIVVVRAPAGDDSTAPVCGDPSQGSGHPAACDKPVGRPSPSVTVIDRIVAGPGNTITIRNGYVIRGGVRERDFGYTKLCGSQPSCDFPAPITIPRGDYFVMGDNRGASDDSRAWGPVPRTYIIGRVVR